MDEYDRLPHHSMQSGSAWVVGGGIALDRLREISSFDLGGDLPLHGAKTLNEWIRGHIGHGVEGGEVLERGGYRVVIRKVRRQMVLEAQVGRAASEEPGPGEEYSV
jgi:CBS domain containing-hemolysin-like protein